MSNKKRDIRIGVLYHVAALVYFVFAAAWMMSSDPRQGSYLAEVANVSIMAGVFIPTGILVFCGARRIVNNGRFS